MKRIFLIFFLIGVVKTINAQTSPRELVASKIAKKLKDSLQLNEAQRSEIYQINLLLNDEKASIRNEFSGTDSLRVKIQNVENTRDFKYSQILSTTEFNLYRQKKKTLINNN